MLGRSIPSLWPAISRQGNREFYFLAALLFSSTLLLAVMIITSEVLRGNATAFDWPIILALRNPADLSDPIGSDLFESMVNDVSSLGGAPVLIIATLTVAGYFVVARRRHAALLLIAAVGGVALVNSVLKLLVARPGFNMELQVYNTSAYSFPSGHAALSAAAYLTMGTLLARAETKPYVKNYVMSAAIALTLLVGVSRLYLGVHLPTDVLAGWSVGAAWTLLCLFGAGVVTRQDYLFIGLPRL
jgi:undecaprenyl-diphosphatase